MKQFNILNRRVFLSRSFKTSMAVALSTLVDIPLVVKRALAEGSIGLNGKKLLFIWLRGANDGLNSVIPVEDSTYYNIRQAIAIQKEASVNYTTTGDCFDPTKYSSDLTQSARGANDSTYSYDRAIRLGNGFAAMHPSLKFLAPLYNAGDLALIHRVAYPKQSQSHFDSQNYWENGNPRNNLSKDGIFYRTMIESGLANTAPLTGVSVQSALPLILRGSDAAMTNLSSPGRYDLLGVPTPAGDNKAFGAISAANYYPFAAKRNRDLLGLQYQNMSNTLRVFANLDFSDAANTFQDNVSTDSDAPYYLFPDSNAKNGGYALHGNDANKYVVPTSSYSFFRNLKAAAMILNKTDAIITGTELGGFDTHQTQGGAAGTHSNLQRIIGWSMYALRQYFMNYHDKAAWDDVVVVTLSEFGRTSVENSDDGTDHAEAGIMFVAGGAIKGRGQGNTYGVFGCSPAEAIPWKTGPRTTLASTCGTMFAAGFPESASTVNPVTAGYLRRSCDYRSVIGEVIRKHLGATQNQLNRIIPGYAVPGEYLLSGGISTVDGVRIRGEVGIL